MNFVHETSGIFPFSLSVKPDRRRSSTNRSYRSYLLRAALLPILLASYVALALFGPREGRAEFYPFFSWNLFPHSSELSADAVILVKEINGQVLPEPVLFFDLPDRFAAARRKDIRLGKMLDNLVHAELGGNAEMAERLSDVVKTTFMSDAYRVKYDVAIVQYKPLERYRNGKIIKTKIVRSDEKIQ